MVISRSVVIEKRRIAEVDPENPAISERDRELLRLLLQKHQTCIEQGRGHESHGMGTAILVIWQVATRPDNRAQLPDSGLGDL
jgi:hypothetical protein